MLRGFLRFSIPVEDHGVPCVTGGPSAAGRPFKCLICSFPLRLVLLLTSQTYRGNKTVFKLSPITTREVKTASGTLLQTPQKLVGIARFHLYRTSSPD